MSKVSKTQLKKKQMLKEKRITLSIINKTIVHLSAGLVKISQRLVSFSFGVKSDDFVHDVGVIAPIERLQVICRHDVQMTLFARVGVINNF